MALPPTEPKPPKPDQRSVAVTQGQTAKNLRKAAKELRVAADNYDAMASSLEGKAA